MNKKLNQEEQDKKKLLWLLWLHDYFHRFYNKEASEKEMRLIENWNPEKLAESPFKPSESKVKRGTEKVWENLSDQYGLTHNGYKPVKIFRLQQLLPYAAAVMILLTASVAMYQYNTYGTMQSLDSLFSDEMKYQTGNGGVKQFMLPDGSTITLNSNTTVAFVKDEFDGNKREIWLKDGEAFFEVAKNPSKPFIVHTQDADVVVRGTSFSITAYRELKKSSVAVRTGRVEVMKDNKVNTLFPSQKAIIDRKAGNVSLSQINTSNIATWREGSLTLSHCDAAELVFRMEQHFDIEIKVQPDLLSDINFSASFEKETSLQDALNSIADIYAIRYTIKNNTVTLYK